MVCIEKEKKKKWLNEKDFKDDIEIIENEMKKIEDFIRNNEFFNQTFNIVEKLKKQLSEESCLNNNINK